MPFFFAMYYKYIILHIFFSVSQHLTKAEKSFAGRDFCFPFQKEIQFGAKWELFINQNMLF